jgi:hypothetical protein
MDHPSHQGQPANDPRRAGSATELTRTGLRMPLRDASFLPWKDGSTVQRRYRVDIPRDAKGMLDRITLRDRQTGAVIFEGSEISNASRFDAVLVSGSAVEAAKASDPRFFFPELEARPEGVLVSHRTISDAAGTLGNDHPFTLAYDAYMETRLAVIEACHQHPPMRW